VWVLCRHGSSLFLSFSLILLIGHGINMTVVLRPILGDDRSYHAFYCR